jgi:hypothetical protein
MSDKSQLLMIGGQVLNIRVKTCHFSGHLSPVSPGPVFLSWRFAFKAGPRSNQPGEGWSLWVGLQDDLRLARLGTLVGMEA